MRLLCHHFLTTMNKILAQCGFSAHEQDILTFLLQHSSASARTIASATKIKRPTTYLTLQGLVDAGLVVKRSQGKTTVFATVPRESLPGILRTRARAKLAAFEQATSQLEDAIARLTPIPSAVLGGLTVESIESERGLLREMYESVLAGDFVGIFNPQLLQGGGVSSLIVDYLKRTAVNRPRIREILVDGPQCTWYRNQIKNPNHEVRILPAECRYLTDMILIDGMLMLIDYSPASPAAVKIVHQNLYTSFYALFEELWERLKPTRTRSRKQTS
jgi:predicted transcriptional regulator